jgi:pyrimidine-nucleoside phosphorylase
MLLLARVAASRDDALAKLRDAISSGRAAERFQQVVEAQGGNPAVVDDPAILPQAGECEIFHAPRRGFVARVEPRTVGRAVVAIGGGRVTLEDELDSAAGFVITARPGQWVESGEPVATVFAATSVGIAAGRAALRQAIVIADEAELPLPLVSHRVTANGVEELGAS